MKIQFTILTAVVLVAPVSGSDLPSEGIGPQLIEGFVTDFTTLQSRFEQSLMDADGRVLEVSSGRLEIQRPGRFRWIYSEPYEQWLVADGLNVWSYDVDLAQVIVKPQAEVLNSTPALLLGGSRDAMKQFTHDGIFEDGGLTWVRLKPVNTDSGFNRLELAFNGTMLSRMVFFDNLEQTTVVSLYDIVVDEPIDPRQFEFVAPDGVDVVGIPVTSEQMDR
ncbi:MAG: outer membrane lipoprotein carrier protein LolA [Proteobacteria bacterium]|nr:outer membrane lipoprotein carrier protein LolA [Pseudomonadota bacterium]